MARPFLSIGQISALLGTVLLCITFMLSSKAAFLERFFGGFDKVYKTHHIISAVSFIFLLNHPLFLIINVLPNTKAAFLYILPGVNLSYDFGIFALWIMCLLVVLTLYIKLPYHVWKKTHEYFGVVLLFSFLHVLLVSNDISRFFPLRLWMFSFLFLSLGLYFYFKILYPNFGPIYKYLIDRIERKEDVLEVYLKPITKVLKFIPGQFAFLQFESPGIEPEVHPFSISSSPNDEFLRFSIKILGDYTLTLKDLRKGSIAKVWGAYGCFSERFFSNKDAVCIAGGIGVTPFLSMIAYEAKKGSNGRQIFLFYCGRDMDELCYNNEIINMTSVDSVVKYIPYSSAERGRIKAKNVFDVVGNLADKLIFLCGPPPMMKDLEVQFLELGVERKNIIFEEFNLK